MEPMSAWRYYVWLVGQWVRWAFLAVVSRGVRVSLGAAIIAALSQYFGVSVIYAPGFAGALTAAALAVVVAWFALFLVNLAIAPFRQWRDGKWYGNRFIYNQPRLAYTAFVGPGDNNKPHTFRFKDAPPNSFVWCSIEVDRMSLTNVDLKCKPRQLKNYTEASNAVASVSGFLVDGKRNMAMTTFVRSDATLRTVRIYVTSWELPK